MRKQFQWMKKVENFAPPYCFFIQLFECIRA